MKKRQIRRIAAAMCSAMLCSGSALMPVMAEGLKSLAQEDALQTRDVLCGNEDVNRWESEHFQFIWGKNGADSAQITESFLQENATHLEACYAVYMDELGMEPPTQSVNLDLRDGNEYKVNIYLSGTGLAAFPNDDWAYMAYDSGGFAYMFCCVGAMQNSPNPSWVLPHEFGHVLTAHQRGWNENKYVQSWWESIGNWYREQFLYSDYYSQWVTDPAGGTDYFETYMKNLCFTPILGRDNYASWAFLQYLTENPDNLDGYGSDFIKTMMQQGQKDEYPYLEIDRLAGADLKDTLGHYAKRLATLDFRMQERYLARQNALLENGEWNWGEIYTVLDQTGEKGNYIVPTERAPQQFGINIIPLRMTGDTISVTLEGLTDVEGADWRACISVKQADGTTRYSDLFKANETAEMAVSSSDREAYLVVTATPDTDTLIQAGVPWAYSEGEFDENNMPFLSKNRYPYAVTITGAEVQQQRSTGAIMQGSYHANGGGFVAATAHVDDSVYVGKNAKVLGYANVTDNARIDGYAIVSGSASVSGNAIVTGHAVVAENATVKDNAIIGDFGGVMGNAVISENARVLESGLVFNTYTVSGNASVKGVAYCLSKGAAYGQAMADGDYYDDSGRSITSGSVYGWASPDTYVDHRPYTDGQTAGLEFSTDSSAIAADTYSSTYAVAQNQPLWEAERTSAEGVLTFTGDEYLIADSSYAALHDAEYQTSVLLRNEGKQTIFRFGTDGNSMELTAEKGNVTFALGDEEVTAENAYIAGQWIIISISLNGDEVKLTVNNGETVTETASMTSDPVDILSGDAMYRIGEGMDGSMDYFRVFFKDVDEPAYTYTKTEAPSAPKGMIGDLDRNDKINVFDLAYLKKAILYGYDDAVTGVVGDCNGSGTIDIVDAIMMQKYLHGFVQTDGNMNIGKKTELPVT